MIKGISHQRRIFSEVAVSILECFRRDLIFNETTHRFVNQLGKNTMKRVIIKKSPFEEHRGIGNDDTSLACMGKNRPFLKVSFCTVFLCFSVYSKLELLEDLMWN